MGLLISKIYNYLFGEICWCGSTDIKIIGGIRTETFYYPFIDDKGKRHHHDGNICRRDYKFSKYIPDKCWCGWIQGLDKTGYQGEKTFKR